MRLAYDGPAVVGVIRIDRTCHPPIRSPMSRVFKMTVASIHTLYVNKAVKKGRTEDEVNTVIQWLTGFDSAELQQHLDDGTTFEDFFAAATLNPHTDLIKGVVCKVRVEDVEDPLMQKIRYLDLLVDELARGKAMDAILRTPST